MVNKVCYITAIFGNYEYKCHPFCKQNYVCDFICFTDNCNIENNGWIINTTPYHLTHNPIDDNSYHNSIINNSHTFNIAKFYKLNWNNIPILDNYDIVIWLDGTVEITNENTTNLIVERLEYEKILTWKHIWHTTLIREVNESLPQKKYSSNFWYKQKQPIQKIKEQYHSYINDDYNDNILKSSNNSKTSIFVTCLIAFKKCDDTINFLNLWYLQNLLWSTQDQVGFPYCCYKTKLIPYILPDNIILGDFNKSSIHIKHNHDASTLS